MSKKTINSTYNLLLHFCSLGKVIIRFYPKYTSELYPEFNFGDETLQKELFVPIHIWFTDGDGTMPWSDVSLVFNNENGELSFDYEDCEIDDLYYPDYEVDEYNEYLLDVEKLKDNKSYTINNL